MKQSEIKAVIFDMDGVILDSETICNRTWIAAAEEMQIDNIEMAMHDCLGMNKADTSAILKKQYGSDFDVQHFMNRTSELFQEIEISEGIPLMPYAKEALEHLKGRYRLALASSTREAVVRRQLADAGIIGYFETITAGDMVKHSKPDPEIYQLACRSISVPPQVCAAVEDSPNGIKSAYAAGLKPVMIPDKIQPTPQIERLLWCRYESLRSLCEEL